MDFSSSYNGKSSKNCHNDLSLSYNGAKQSNA